MVSITAFGKPNVKNKERTFEEINAKMAEVQKAIEKVLVKINKFKILDEQLVPYGLKPIARSSL